MVIHVSIEKETLIFKMKDGSFYCSSVFHQNIVSLLQPPVHQDCPQDYL